MHDFSQKVLLIQGGFARQNFSIHYFEYFFYDEPSDEIAEGHNNNFHNSLEANPQHTVFHPPQGKNSIKHQISQSSNPSRMQPGKQIQPRSYAFSHLSTKEECTYCCAGVSQNKPQHLTLSASCMGQKGGMLAMIQKGLSDRYSSNRDFYNLKIVNDLIYNENTHVVSIFKDYLILDDINEFLKRPYTLQETKTRLPKLCTFYEKYSQVFPNYVTLPESKYMFKNIQRKQKLIDEQFQLQEELAKKKRHSLLDEDRLFSDKFYNSFYDLSMSRQQYEDQAKVIQNPKPKKGGVPQQLTLQNRKKLIEQMDMDELVDHFIVRDSQSNIQIGQSMLNDISSFTQQSSIFEKQPIVAPAKPAPQQQQQTVQRGGNAIIMVSQAQTTKIPRNLTPGMPLNMVVKQKSSQPAKLKTTPKSSSHTGRAGQQSRDQKDNSAKIQSNSNKATPRLKQQANNRYDNQQVSPDTRDALTHYLNTEQIQASNLKKTDMLRNILPVVSPQQAQLTSPQNHLISSASGSIVLQGNQPQTFLRPSANQPSSSLSHSKQSSSRLSTQQQLFSSQSTHALNKYASRNEGNNHIKYLSGADTYKTMESFKKDNYMLPPKHSGDEVADERYVGVRKDVGSIDGYDQIKQHLEQYLKQNHNGVNEVYAQPQIKGFTTTQSKVLAQSSSRNNLGARNSESFKNLQQQLRATPSKVLFTQNPPPRTATGMLVSELMDQQQKRMSVDTHRAYLSGTMLNYLSGETLKSKQQETKRMSTNSRSSFKDSQSNQMKRSATGKNLSINQMMMLSQPLTQGLGSLNHVEFKNNQALKALATSSSTKKIAQQVPQKAATSRQNSGVRMLSPQYSISSLSKLISPTSGASPVATMTVTLAGANLHSQKFPQKKQTSSSNGSRKGSSQGITAYTSLGQPKVSLISSSSLSNIFNQPSASVVDSSKGKLIQQQIKTAKANLQQMPAKVIKASSSQEGLTPRGYITGKSQQASNMLISDGGNTYAVPKTHREQIAPANHPYQVSLQPSYSVSILQQQPMIARKNSNPTLQMMSNNHRNAQQVMLAQKRQSAGTALQMARPQVGMATAVQHQQMIMQVQKKYQK